MHEPIFIKLAGSIYYVNPKKFEIGILEKMFHLRIIDVFIHKRHVLLFQIQGRTENQKFKFCWFLERL